MIKYFKPGPIAAGGLILLYCQAVDNVAAATIPGHEPTVEIFALQSSAAIGTGQDMTLGNIFPLVEPERQRTSDQDRQTRDYFELGKPRL